MKYQGVVTVVLLLVGTAWAAWPNPGTPTCPKGWHTYEHSTCLKLFAQEEPWDEARRQCGFNQATADLAMIDTDHKRAFIHTMIHAKPPFLKCGLLGIKSYWIGANDRHNEWTFEWNDTGTKCAYTNWAFLEPNNLFNQDCVEVKYGSSKWHSSDCGKKQCFVCEKALHDQEVP